MEDNKVRTLFNETESVTDLDMYIISKVELSANLVMEKSQEELCGINIIDKLTIILLILSSIYIVCSY